MSMEIAARTESLKQRARQLGFDLAGACPAVTPAGVTRLAEWLQHGFAGEMQYIERRRQAYAHPDHVLDGCRSILMLSMNYSVAAEQKESRSAGHGRVARYAGSRDYHDVIREKLNALTDFLRTLAPAAVARGVVDTAPLLEREFAQLAGLGWIGKNTMLLNPRRGSYFFLAALLTDLELAYDEPTTVDHCGSCTACLDACPTDAFASPHVLDSRKCISYLTIELKAPIPRPLRAGVGNWLFGCDVCQEVCPWNRFAPQTVDAAIAPQDHATSLDPCELLRLDDEEFRRRFRETPLWRPRRRGILRNAAIVLGNTRPPHGVAALAIAINDVEPLIRGAAAWALGQYGHDMAQTLLRQRADVEHDAEVREEIEVALAIRSAD
ncbi:MAG: tRNA epoxyqueuosine(34) reductase QueG [Pirellulales bacterium]